MKMLGAEKYNNTVVYDIYTGVYNAERSSFGVCVLVSDICCVLEVQCEAVGRCSSFAGCNMFYFRR